MIAIDHLQSVPVCLIVFVRVHRRKLNDEELSDPFFETQ
jgi:hypothetical protein